MRNPNKIISITFISLCFIVFLLISQITKDYQVYTVKDVVNPCVIVLNNNEQYKLKGFEVFDPAYSEHNKSLSQKLNITEDEGFIIGAFGKYWAKNILNGRKVKIKENNLVYYKFGYLTRFKNSPFCIKDGKPLNQTAFNRQLDSIRKGQFVIFDLDTEKYYAVSKENLKNVTNYIVVRKGHIKHLTKQHKKTLSIIPAKFRNNIYSDGNIKIIISDFTTKTIPDRNCSSDICKTILSEINKTKSSLDMAIYGYSATPVIEKALQDAQKRGVKVRMVYDSDAKGNNIYPDTYMFTGLISANKSDINSPEANKTMHNKFFIFDNKIVITGSANLSHTDMSGYNTNIVLLINSPKIAEYYTNEFNQMYNGRFHNEKIAIPEKTADNISIYFSPKDKTISNGVLPVIKNAKKYIYISTFVITEKRMTEELINAKNRGVDIKIIADALNASTKHSKHRELCSAGILVKAENYAGKMHSKSIITDDEYLIVGSMNFSNSGENYNDENCIILRSQGAARFNKEFFLYQWNRIPDKWLTKIPRAESYDSIGSCSDGIDNDYDGKTDKEDVSCSSKLK